MQKPSATSAASTTFCAARVEGFGSCLWIDGNGKITAGNGTLDEPKPNAFSLVQIEDCPGSTPLCREICYVHSLEKHAPTTHALYRHNSKMIREILSDPKDAEAWAIRLGAWISENCPGGFRWHVSGDIFSEDYAWWIADVCCRSKLVDHWIYTRSFEYIGPLLSVTMQAGGNLALNLSCDEYNFGQAVALAREHDLRLCYLTSTWQQSSQLWGIIPSGLRDGDVIFPDYELRGGTEAGQQWFAGLSPRHKRMICPVDYHGKTERRRCGPCDRCLVTAG